MLSFDPVSSEARASISLYHSPDFAVSKHLESVNRLLTIIQRLAAPVMYARTSAKVCTFIEQKRPVTSVQKQQEYVTKIQTEIDELQKRLGYMRIALPQTRDITFLVTFPGQTRTLKK